MSNGITAESAKRRARCFRIAQPAIIARFASVEAESPVNSEPSYHTVVSLFRYTP